MKPTKCNGRHSIYKHIQKVDQCRTIQCEHTMHLTQNSLENTYVYVQLYMYNEIIFRYISIIPLDYKP